MKKVFLFFALACSLAAGAQSKDSVKTAAIKTLLESGNYRFKAQSALPLAGHAWELTSEYDMTVTMPGKIVSNLPYYGRSYTAPVDPTRGAMSFTTKDFDYTITPHKKGGWDITIKPKDLKGDVDVRQLYLTVTRDGYASLRAVSNTRDAISYSGIIVPSK